MSRLYVKRKSVVLAGTALLGAVVFVLDWTSKITGLGKIPFPIPPLTYLIFDFIGIPMLLAYFLFGFPSGVTTSLIGFLSISFRDPFKAFMKFLPELATIVGVYVVLRKRKPSDNKLKVLAILSGIIVRVAVMAIAVVSLLPTVGYYPTHMAVIVLLHLFSVFNVIQGFISAFGGFFLYEAVIRRLPSLK